MSRIFHLTTESEWQAALREGRYTGSTRGRTLAEEGFIHASRADQWQDVRRRFYADVTEPLVLLVIDTGLLDVPVIPEAAPGGEEFPHVYGPLNLNAVVQAVPLTAAEGVDGAGGESFGSIFLREMFRNAGLGLLLLLLALAGTLLGTTVPRAWGPWAGLAAGLAVGAAVIRLLNARRT